VKLYDYVGGGKKNYKQQPAFIVCLILYDMMRLAKLGYRDCLDTRVYKVFSSEKLSKIL